MNATTINCKIIKLTKNNKSKVLPSTAVVLFVIAVMMTY